MVKIKHLGLIVILGLFASCSEHNPNCPKLAKIHKIEKQYLVSHKCEVGKVDLYVENSGSMDGYVHGNTEFKTDLFNVVKLLGGKEPVDKFFINADTIIRTNLSDYDFSNGMSVGVFQKWGGNRESSNIAELLEKIIWETDSKGISVFVSDCVFDPQNDPDIEKRLGQQKTTIQTALKRKLGKDSNFGVVVYRLMSSFTGFYYNKVKPHTYLTNTQRPYYMWIFGDANKLREVRNLLGKDVESRAGKNIIVAMNTIEGLPYYCPSAKCNQARGKHIEEPKEVKGIFSFWVKVDFRTLPLDDAYLMNVANYDLPKNSDYVIEKVRKCKKQDSKYTHEIRIVKNKGNVKKNTLLEIVLKHPKIPGWVVADTDEKGIDFLNGNIRKTNRTFGLKSYVDGIYDAYETNIANFKILIK